MGMRPHTHLEIEAIQSDTTGEGTVGISDLEQVLHVLVYWRRLQLEQYVYYSVFHADMLHPWKHCLSKCRCSDRSNFHLEEFERLSVCEQGSWKSFTTVVHSLPDRGLFLNSGSDTHYHRAKTTRQ